MDIGLIALLVLLLVVIVGFLLKLNVGLLAIAGAVILGYVSGMFSGSEIIGGFSASLFMTLLGVTLFFGIIQDNGCIELVMRKLVGLFGNQIWLIPILMYVIGFAVAAIGPGCVPAMAFAATMAIPLAHESGYHPIMLMIIGNLGTYCGRFSPITPEGVLIKSLLGEQDIAVPSSTLLLNTFIGTLILSVIVFVVYKGFKVKRPEHQTIQRESLKLDSKQVIALCSVMVMILLVILFGMDVGLASFLVSAVLILLKIGDEKTAFGSVPWNTLILVCGVGVLMNLVISTGGIDLLADTMSAAMSSWSAGGILGLISAIMSWFSSAIGVVFPTLMPTVGTIAQNVGGNVNVSELVTVIALFASVAGLSPASTGGAVIMGACASDKEFGKKYPSEKLFVEMLLWAVGTIAVLTVLAFVGVFKIFG